MSLEDFKGMGLLRDEANWGHQGSGVRGTTMIVAMLVSLAACAIMIYGNGGWLTAVGIGLFLIGLFALIRTNLRGVKRSNHE